MFLDLSPWLTFYILTASLILSTIRFVVLGLTQSLPTSLSIDKLDTFRESIFFPGRYLSIYPLLPPLSNTIKNQSWTLVVSQSCSCRLFYSTITSYCLTKVSCLTLVSAPTLWSLVSTGDTGVWSPVQMMMVTHPWHLPLEHAGDCGHETTLEHTCGQWLVGTSVCSSVSTAGDDLCPNLCVLTCATNTDCWESNIWTADLSQAL